MVIGVVGQEAEKHQPEQHLEKLTVLQANSTEPLSDCVRSALKYYLKNLDGHEVNDLHEMVMGEVELPLIETILAYTQGNQTKAARMLGVSRSTLRKKMVHYGLR